MPAIPPGEVHGSEDSRHWLMSSHDLCEWTDPQPLAPQGCKAHWGKQNGTFVYVRSQGLDFNLIVDSEAGGQTSNQLFYENTLRMVEICMAAGGHPDHYIIQSWYSLVGLSGPICPECGETVWSTRSKLACSD